MSHQYEFTLNFDPLNQEHWAVLADMHDIPATALEDITSVAESYLETDGCILAIQDFNEMLEDTCSEDTRELFHLNSDGYRLSTTPRRAMNTLEKLGLPWEADSHVDPTTGHEILLEQETRNPEHVRALLKLLGVKSAHAKAILSAGISLTWGW